VVSNDKGTGGFLLEGGKQIKDRTHLGVAVLIAVMQTHQRIKKANIRPVPP